MSWRTVLGIAGLIGASSASAGPVRSYDYTLEYALSPSVQGQVQREHQDVCRHLRPPRCRVVLSRSTQGKGAAGDMTVEVTRAMVPQVLDEFAGIVDEAGGKVLSRELRITEGKDATPPDDTASIAVTYVGRPGFADQAGEALRAFGPTLRASLVSAIYLLPALAPWLATVALVVWGLRTAWRHRAKVA